MQPKVGDLLITVLSSSPLVNKKTKLTTHQGRLDKASRKERRIAAVYSTGMVKDHVGDVWEVTKTDKPNVWRAIN